MGPQPTTSIMLPSRPKFHWDVKSPPWTDARGDQLEYKNRVMLWKHFRDSVPANNSNKIPSNLQAICLKSQLFGRAIDICSGISNTELTAEDGVDKVVNAIYQQDALSVVSEAYKTFNDLLDTRRGQTETMKRFESRFSASVAKFNAISESTKLPQCLTALMLIPNSFVSDAQRVSILAGAAAASEVENVATATNEEFLQSVSYSSVAFVIRQCEGSNDYEGRSIRANLGTVLNGRMHGRFQGNPRLNRENYEVKTMKYPCAICGKYGHWKNEHLADGSLPDGVKCVDKPAEDGKENGNNGANASGSNSTDFKKTVSFNSANLLMENGNDTVNNEKNRLKPSMEIPNAEDTCPGINKNYNYITNRNVKCECKDSQDEQECVFCSDWSLPDPMIHMEAPTETLTGNNALLSGSMGEFGCNDKAIRLGPLVDDGAPYSAIGAVELEILLSCLGLKMPRQLENIPDVLNGYSRFQYGTGSHSIESRKIIGSIILTAYSDNNRKIDIRHIVVSGSSQWIIGRNVTRKANIEHINNNALIFRCEDNTETDCTTMVEDNFLTYIPFERFHCNSAKGALCSQSAVALKNRPWSQVKNMIDRVHKHVCGHASFSDFKLLFERNHLWNETVERYIQELVRDCKSCHAADLPTPSRKISISSLSNELNEIICVDHFYLDDIVLVHFMDLATRFLTLSIVLDKSMGTVITAFEKTWVTHFWYPNKISDKPFGEGEFKSFMEERDINFELVPAGRHSRNAIESKLAVIRHIFIRLTEDQHYSKETAAIKAVAISNELYGNSTISAYEMAKGFSKPIDGMIYKVPDEVVKAHEEIQARRKLARILKSKSYPEPDLAVGDMVEIYVHGKNNKLGEWSIPKKIIKIDKNGRNIFLPGKAGRTVCAAYEDVRKAIGENEFSKIISKALDDIDEQIELDLENESNIDHRDEMDPENNKCSAQEEGFEDSNEMSLPLIGEKVEIYWPLDEQYYPGTVGSMEAGNYIINYEDGCVETLDMSQEIWKYQENCDENIAASNLRITSNEQEVLDSMFKTFGNKSFLNFQCQGYEMHPLYNAYQKEEEQFLKIVETVPIGSIPADSNVVNSHVIYKLKYNDDKTLALKSRKAPHGNEDSEKEILTTDCQTCPPTGIRIVLSVSALFGWKLKRADAKGAFLKTGKAQRHVYVIPPTESRMTSTHRWHLLVAAYGLVNSGAKCQHQSDDLLLDLGLIQSKYVHQLFLKFKKQKLELILAKIVDDIIITGEEDKTEKLISDFNSVFELGSIVEGPGDIRFFGTNIVQNDDRSVIINADDKLASVFEYGLSRQRRKHMEDPANELEKKAFMSVNSTLGWIGSACSPICSYYSSYLQQKLPNLCVKHIVEQNTIINKFQKIGTTIQYPRPLLNKELQISVIVFPDASKTDESGQLGLITGLMLGDMRDGSTFHTLSWLSHKSRRPVKSVPAAAILASSEGIDEGK